MLPVKGVCLCCRESSAATLIFPLKKVLKLPADDRAQTPPRVCYTFGGLFGGVSVLLIFFCRCQFCNFKGYLSQKQK